MPTYYVLLRMGPFFIMLHKQILIYTEIRIMTLLREANACPSFRGPWLTLFPPKEADPVFLYIHISP